MQDVDRDLLEVLIFDEIEDTVGTWLRAIIQRLENEQAAIRRDYHKEPTPIGDTLRGTLLCQKGHQKSAKPVLSGSVGAAAESSSDSGRSGFDSCEDGTPLPSFP